MKWKHHLPLPVDSAVIRILAESADKGEEHLHGYELADRLASDPRFECPIDSAGLRSNGTIYKSLHRLTRCRAVSGHWEEADTALAECRPRRRYYTLTENGLARARLMDRQLALHSWLTEAYAKAQRGA